MDRLGIIDWGIGGISIYNLIRERIGDVPTTYFSDTGVTPYGRMTRPELVARLNSVIPFLKDRGITHLVIGCNAASTALPHLDRAGLTVEGVIEPAIRMAAKMKPKSLSVIGGRRTVVSGVYRRGFRKFAIEIRQRIAQPLSGMIESGDVGSERLRNAARHILRPIRSSSHILLACTHYPAITPLLQEVVSAETKFIDPAVEMMRIVDRWRIKANGDEEFLTSGDAAQMIASANNAFGVKIKKASTIKL